jgi:hypothetical protein
VRAPTTTDTNPTTTTRTADGRSGSAWGRSTRPSAARGRGLAEAETQPVLLEAVMAQRLDGEWWQGEEGVAGRGLERPDRQLLADATHPSAAVAIGVVGEDGGVDDGERLPELDGAGVQVQVGPFRAAQLAVAGPVAAAGAACWRQAWRVACGCAQALLNRRSR